MALVDDFSPRPPTLVDEGSGAFPSSIHIFSSDCGGGRSLLFLLFHNDDDAVADPSTAVLLLLLVIVVVVVVVVVDASFEGPS